MKALIITYAEALQDTKLAPKGNLRPLRHLSLGTGVPRTFAQEKTAFYHSGSYLPPTLLYLALCGHLFSEWAPSLPCRKRHFCAPFNSAWFRQVTTNGLIAMSEPPATESHPGLFPPTFGAVAPFLADLDTTDGLGKVYYREDFSPSVTQLAAECVQRGFPEASFQPKSVVVVTWDSVAPYQGPSEDPAQEDKVSTHPGSSAESHRSAPPGWCYSEVPCAVSLIKAGHPKQNEQARHL